MRQAPGAGERVREYGMDTLGNVVAESVAVIVEPMDPVVAGIRSLMFPSYVSVTLTFCLMRVVGSPNVASAVPVNDPWGVLKVAPFHSAFAVFVVSPQGEGLAEYLHE